MNAFTPGQILGERYQLVRVIAVGTFGVVWHAEHLALCAPVAVKVLDPLSLKGEARQRFITEALAAAALRSPHVVQILDCGIEGDTPYIVMELLEGESLAERLNRVPRLTAAETSRVVRHVARAIDRARDAGIVHRDLKPGNIFIQANDGEELIKVLDFGIARTSPWFFGALASQSSPGWSGSSALNLTPPGVILGTPHYMSPEQASGALGLDYRTDIWSLGTIAYECLVGRPPHDGETVHEVLAKIVSGVQVIPSRHADVPAGFDAWFARACAYDASARYESGKQAADEFLALCGLPASESALDRTHHLSSASSARPLDERRGERRASWVARVFRPPAGRARSAWAAALGAAALGAGWWLVDARLDAVPAPRSAVTTSSARLQPSPSPTPRSVNQASEPPVAGRITPSEGAALATALPHPSNAGGTDAADRDEPAGTTTAASAKQPTSSSSRATTQTPERRARKKAARLARDCREPWFFDDQGLPRVKLQCL